MQRIAIIGAGISALSCAGKLASNYEVTLFDKSRGVAGRMATRRVPDQQIQFDHGAQYFTVRSEQVKSLLQGWIEEGIVAPWHGRIVLLHADKTCEDRMGDRFVAVPGMNALAKHLAQNLQVETNCQIASVQHGEVGWSLVDNQGTSRSGFDGLVISTPPRQAYEVLGGASILDEQLSSVHVAPCWATLLSLEKRIDVPFDGAFVEDSPLSWIARNSSKPGRMPDRECWVLHASPTWSEENLEASADAVTSELLKAFQTAIGKPLPAITYQTSHRWRYSIPTNPLEDRFIWDASQNLGICGDWCAGARVEGAIQSGLAVGQHILDL